MLPFYCVRISTRNSWRSRRDTKSGATVQSIAAINEVALRFIFSTLIHHFFREKEELEERCENTSQCLEECSSKYEELMRAYCRDVLVSRDHRVAEYVRCSGSGGLRALQLARIPGFPLLEMQEAVLGAARWMSNSKPLGRRGKPLSSIACSPTSKQTRLCWNAWSRTTLPWMAWRTLSHMQTPSPSGKERFWCWIPVQRCSHSSR